MEQSMGQALTHSRPVREWRVNGTGTDPFKTGAREASDGISLAE